MGRKTFKNHKKSATQTVKRNGKSRVRAESYSASEAAAALGMSIPTVKRMAQEGRIEGFRTPGGHLRVSAESVEALKDHRQPHARGVANASSVLQSKREEVEALLLESQALKARQGLERLQRSELEQAKSADAEAEERKQDAALRQAELDLERERLHFERAQEREKAKAERDLDEFRTRWMKNSTEGVSSLYAAFFLTAHERKEILDALEAEVEKRSPSDEPRMLQILALTMRTVVERLIAEREARDMRERILSSSVSDLGLFATEAERTQATATVRHAISRVPSDARESEIRATAGQALSPIKHAVEKRRQDQRIVNWAASKLPWHSSDLDKARLRRECAEILAELPGDYTELEA